MQNTAASGKTGTTGGPTTGGTTTGGTTSGNSTTTEKPNTDIVVTPSNANALLLMDAGAQSPKAVPGQEVDPIKISFANFFLNALFVPATIKSS